MTAPHEAVITALTYMRDSDGNLVKDQYYGLDNVTYEAIATAVIAALREGATERANAAPLNQDGFPAVHTKHRDAIINAILGSPEK